LWSTAIAEVDLDDPQLGTIWGPFDGKVGAEGIASRGEGAGVRVKITLGRGEGTVSRDLPEDVHWDACIRQPGKSRVPEIIPAEGGRNRVRLLLHPNVSRHGGPRW
jgi:hypothetical protein